jgi:phosphate uptake regulator
MLHGSEILGIIGIYLIVIVFVLTMLWRVARALERISSHLSEIAQDVKKLSEHP